MADRHCLLVVDDEPEVVHSLQDLLRFDYRVLGATRAAEGLRILEREQVHIVMSDQRMPEMTGVQFLEQLHQSHPDIVRLLFTGFADIKAVIDAINQGHVFRYVTKPWDADELQAVLRQATERYDLLAERKRLLAEVQEQNRRLEALNVELQQANDLKLAFIKVASHELRTPLTVVLGLSELLRESPEVVASIQPWVEQIHRGSVRLNRLVDQIIEMLRAGDFARRLKRTQVCVHELLRSATEEVSAFVAQRQQILQAQAPTDLGNIQVDPDKLRDCVTHLLLNAIKFTPDGGTIRLEARRLEKSIEISVHDSGIGMDAECLKHVFDPFFTGFDVSRHSSGTFEYCRSGLGMGLTLVKAFVEMHGGHVRAVSTPGKGSTFTITIPPNGERGV